MYMPVDVIRTRYARNTSVKFLTRLSVHLPSPVLLYSWPMSLALRQPCTACSNSGFRGSDWGATPS